MNTYKLNYSLSKELYDKTYKYINPKTCYNNVLTIFYREMLLDKKYADYKIVFGGWQVSPYQDNFFCKHCFFMKDNEVIDPTVMIDYKDLDKDIKYIVGTVLTKKEISNISQLDQLYDLCNKIIDVDLNKLSRELYQQGIILAG